MASLADILDKMIDDSPKGAVAAQIQIRGGMYAGAVRRSKEHEGLYELGTPGQNKQSGQLQIINVIFPPEHIDALFVESEEEVPAIHVPNGAGGLHIPGVK